MSKEKPLLFKPEMVRAILAGKKTQTRRVVKMPKWAEPVNEDHDFELDDLFIGGKARLWPYAIDKGTGCLASIDCPFGEVGDRLWVKESWQYYDWTEDGEPWIRYAADNQALIRQHTEEWAERVTDIWEKLSRPGNCNIDSRARDRKWRPSIHMPRWACRLVLEITDVRVERLQDITEEDILSEGVRLPPTILFPGTNTLWKLRQQMEKLWNSIHSKDGCDWDQNPWLWVITFRRMEQVAG